MSYEITFGFEANEVFVKLSFPDGTVVHIHRAGVEESLRRHPQDQFLLDTLVFNEPLRYVQLTLTGRLECWLSDKR